MSEEKIVEETIQLSVEMENVIEALIFASDEPLTVRTIRGLVEQANNDETNPQKIEINAEVIRTLIAKLNKQYERLKKPYRIIQVAGGYVFSTKEDFSSWIGKLEKEKAKRKLSTTAVETLAIIAYKQPIAKNEIEFIRGVNADYIMKTLLEKNLIRITGRANTPGRPLLYGTTDEFLKHFGLNELSDLPKPREIEELIGETELEVEKRMLAEQQQIEFKEELAKKIEKPETKSKAGHIPIKKQKTEEVKKEEKIENKEIQIEKSSTPIEEKIEIRDNQNVEEKQEIEKIEIENKIENEKIEETKSLNPKIESTDIETKKIEITEEKPVIIKKSEKQIQKIETEIRINIEEPKIIEKPETIKEKLEAKSTSQQPEKRVFIDNEIYHNEDSQFERVAESETGWGKWKTKIKTFFQKLFT